MPLSLSLHRISLYQTYLARTAAVLAGVCALSVFLYGTFLLLAVVHTATHTEAQRQIADVTAQLGDLESQYLAYTRELTPDRAAALGFVAPKSVTTVFATAAQRALTLRGN